LQSDTMMTLRLQDDKMNLGGQDEFKYDKIIGGITRRAAG